MVVILLGRIDRLKEAHLSLEHTKYRTVKDLSIWDHRDHSGEPIVVRKAHGLALLLDETPPIILDDELIVGLRTIYSSIEEGMNVFRGYGELPVNPATRHSLFAYPLYLTDGERAEAEAAGISEGSCTRAQTGRYPYIGLGSNPTEPTSNQATLFYILRLP